MDFGSLPVSDVRIVDRACDDFELAWRNGGRPRIEDYMNDASEPRRSALLRALLATELESRRARGERPGPEEYLLSVPGRRRARHCRLCGGAYGHACFASGTGSLCIAAGLLARGQSRWLSGARRLLAKRMWALPLVAAVILAVAGFWANTTIERVMRAQVESELLALTRRRCRGAESPVWSPRGTHLVRRQRSPRSEVGARPTRKGRPRYGRTTSCARASRSPRGAHVLDGPV